MDQSILRVLEQHIDTIWKVMLCWITLCATGFFTLLAMVWKSSKEMKSPLVEIRDALVGTYDKPGLIPKFHTLRTRVETMDDRCQKTHAG